MKKLIYKKELVLESGYVFPETEIAYHTYGTPGNKVVWFCHAFTANSDPADWWDGLVGNGKLYDPKEYYIVCANILGSCYGSTGPLSENPLTGKPFYRDFPLITVRDMVKAHEILRKELQIEKIHTLIGGSVGGQQALEWAIENPELINNLVLIATNAKFSAWGIAFSESQRMAIEADPTYYSDKPHGGEQGLKAARSIALLSYRNGKAYNKTQTDDFMHLSNDFRVRSYQQYQGEKLSKRFNAYSYYTISHSLDSHNVGRGRGGVYNALKKIKANTLIFGIPGDILFPVEEQEFLHKNIKNSEFRKIKSEFGHDGFLLEYEQLEKWIGKFYAINKKNKEISLFKVFEQKWNFFIKKIQLKTTEYTAVV